MTLLNQKQLDKCKQIFEDIDTNNSGGIDFYELYSAITKFSKTVSANEIIEIFNEFDIDNSGEIDFNEFTTIIKKFNFNINDEENAIETFIALGATDENSLLDISLINNYLLTFGIEYDSELLKNHSINGKMNLKNFKKLFFDMNLKID